MTHGSRAARQATAENGLSVACVQGRTCLVGLECWTPPAAALRPYEETPQVLHNDLVTITPRPESWRGNASLPKPGVGLPASSTRLKPVRVLIPPERRNV
jgi:hypothetical protein